MPTITTPSIGLPGSYWLAKRSSGWTETFAKQPVLCASQVSCCPYSQYIDLERMPEELVDEAWARFRAALEPLRAAGKLGAVFFQFPPWFLPSSRSLAYVEQVQERMFGFQIAVEFRKPEWLDARHREGTMAFLGTRDIPYVAVD